MNDKFAKTEISPLWKLLDPNTYTSSSVTFTSSINLKFHTLCSKRKRNGLTSTARLSC